MFTKEMPQFENIEKLLIDVIPLWFSYNIYYER